MSSLQVYKRAHLGYPFPQLELDSSSPFVAFLFIFVATPPVTVPPHPSERPYVLPENLQPSISTSIPIPIIFIIIIIMRLSTALIALSLALTSSVFAYPTVPASTYLDLTLTQRDIPPVFELAKRMPESSSSGGRSGGGRSGNTNPTGNTQQAGRGGGQGGYPPHAQAGRGGGQAGYPPQAQAGRSGGQAPPAAYPPQAQAGRGSNDFTIHRPTQGRQSGYSSLSNYAGQNPTGYTQQAGRGGGQAPPAAYPPQAQAGRGAGQAPQAAAAAFAHNNPLHFPPTQNQQSGYSSLANHAGQNPSGYSRGRGRGY
ncbi:hypothetical protein K474DRAFT_1662521 [Panus rudis PR-1116 ss-1]|nr:hypothetical protein K474DRAFT_1662521 [Panus rudis PR-1116 ss-1]